MKKRVCLFSCVITAAALLLSSCAATNMGGGVSDGSEGSEIVGGTTQLGTVIEGPALAGEAGAVDTAEIEFKGKDIYSDYKGAIEIQLSDSLAAEGPNYTLGDSTLRISGEGSYVLRGKLTDGQIVVDAPKDADVRLVLAGVDIYCSYSAPIFINSADKVIVSLPEGSENKLEDKATSTTSDGIEITSALHSRESLSVNGTGKLSITAANDGITSKDTLKITGGVISIDAKDDGIVGKDRVLIRDGDITVSAVGDGIKSTNSKDAALGYVYIEGGRIKITTDGDGIDAQTSMLIIGGEFDIKTGGGSANVTSSGQMQGGGFFGRYPTSSQSSAVNSVSIKALKAAAYLDISGGSFNIDSADDAIHSNDTVRINNGTFTISTGDDGVHADKKLEISGGAITINKSYEGIEAQDIAVSGGYINVTSSDDGFNAAGGSDGNDGADRMWQDRFNTAQKVSFVISGGEIYVNAQGDGIDSNGDLTISGGIVCVSGPTNSGNGYMDIGDNGCAFYMNGGIYLGVGTSGMLVTPSTQSQQNSVTASVSGKAGSTLSIKTQDGEELICFAVAKQYTTFTVSHPDIKIGDKISVYIDGQKQLDVECTSVSTGGSGGSGGMGGMGGNSAQKPSGVRPR